MADWSLPTTSSNYASVFLPQLLNRDVDIATQFASLTGVTNIPNNALRWVAANNRWEIYNSGTATWSAWTANLAVTTLTLGQDPTSALQAATRQYVDNGLALKAPLASPALTGTPTAPTATAGTNTTQVATTAFVATSFAPLASPALTGTPTAPTAAITVSNTQVASTAYVQAAIGTSSAVSVAGGVDVTLTAAQYAAAIIVLSGALTGNINVIFPTSTKSWIVLNSTSGAYTLTCKTAAGSGVAIKQGKGNALWGDGSSLYAEQSDFDSLALTGTPTAPTATAGTNTTQVATTAFIAASFAPLASPALTGTPTAPTATAGTNTTQVATTAFVAASFAPLASPALTGTPTAPTATAGTNTTQVATTAFVAASFAPLASPALTGTPTAPTAATTVSSTQIATTAFVQAVVGTKTSISVAGGVDVTLSSAQYNSPILVFTGALTANINVIFPASTKSWIVLNSTTGSFSLTCKTAAGTGIAVSQGFGNALWGDGTNILAEQSDWANLALTGTPTAPTASAGTNTTQVATTAFVATSFAPLASPALTGTPTAPTAAAGTNTTQVATTAFVAASFATTTAVASTYAQLASPALTGTPTAPTAANTISSTQIATTAFVQSVIGTKTSLSVAGGVDMTLTAAQYNTSFLVFTGALTANINVIFPTSTKSWIVLNSTSGAYTLTCKTASGTGIAVAQGFGNVLWGDGTNLLTGQSDWANLALTGAPTAPTVTAGDNSTKIATTAFVATSFAPLASPALTGTPTAPTATAGDSSTKIATTSFVATSFAPLASPALTGTPTAPTATAGTNSTQLATTAFVQAAITASATPAMPSGTVVANAASSVPSGWLECNGSAVSRTTYSALYTAIGTTYGTGDGSTTFNLPDLRGEFIRGYDNGRGVDTGRVLGSAQAGQFAAHNHGVTDPGHSHIERYNTNTAGGFAMAQGNSFQGTPVNSSATTATSTTGITTQNAGAGTETRPRNIAMMYIIKF